MNVPKLRFKEFSGEWEEKKLKDISILTDGTHSTPKYKDKGIPFWSVETITTNAPVKYISIEEHQKLIKRCNPEFGDILITRISSGINSLGVPKLVSWKEDFSIYVSVGLIKSYGAFDSQYLTNYIESPKYKREFLSKSLLTATPKKINMHDLGETSLKLPSLDEQKRIGVFLEVINKRIQLQQQKIDLLQEQKKGYMQKIFKQELRFKDEDGKDYPEWEKYKLSDLGETYTGLSGKTKEDFGIGDNSFVTYVNVFNNLFAKKTGVEKVIVGENEKQNYVKSGDIFLTTSSETPKEVGMASIWLHESQNLHLNSFCFGYRVTNSKSLPEFLAISLRSEYMRKKITILAQGSTRYNISKTELMKELVYLPSIDEQKKIVTFYLSVGFEIELEMDKLAILKQQKKGFMQQMFI